MGDPADSNKLSIAEIKRRKAKRKVISDNNDAYAMKYQEILKRNKWRPDKAREEYRQLEKKNTSVCENVLKTRMENPEVAAKAEQELLEEDSERIRATYHIYNQLRTRRKQQFLDDEELYGSDQSDTEERIERAAMIQTKRERIQSPQLNDGMAARRARIVSGMSSNFENLDQQQLERQKKIREMEMERKRVYDSRLNRSGSVRSDTVSLPNIDTPRESRMSCTASVASQSPQVQHKEVREACDNLVGIFAKEMDKEVDFYRLLVSAYARQKEESSRNSSRTDSRSTYSATPPRELEPIGEVPSEKKEKDKKKKKDKEKKTEDKEKEPKEDLKEDVKEPEPSTSTAGEKEEKKEKKSKKDKEKKKKKDKEDEKEEKDTEKEAKETEKKKDKKKKKEKKESDDTDQKKEKDSEKGGDDQPADDKPKKKKKDKKKDKKDDS